MFADKTVKGGGGELFTGEVVFLKQAAITFIKKIKRQVISYNTHRYLIYGKLNGDFNMFSPISSADKGLNSLVNESGSSHTNSHRQTSDGKKESLNSVIKFLKDNGFDCAVLEDITKCHKEYDEDDILDTLADEAQSYFKTDSGPINKNFAKGFVEQLLSLKKSSTSEDFHGSVLDELGHISQKAYYTDNLSPDVLWFVVDALLDFDEWKRVCTDTDLTSLTTTYCSNNKPDPEKLGLLIKAIKDDLKDNKNQLFRALFSNVATEYFASNANDPLVARQVIDSLAFLFENESSYNKQNHFGNDDVIFCDLPNEIKLVDTLKACVDWFFYEKTSGTDFAVLAELIDTIRKQGGYDIVALAKSVYQKDDDVSKQLCILDSLALLEKKNDEDLSQSIDAVAQFYLSEIAGNQEKLAALQSNLSKRQYTDRCKNAIEKRGVA